MKSVDSMMFAKKNYKSCTSDNYLHHWVDPTAGWRFVPEGITSPVVNTSVLTWISIIRSFLYKFPVYKTLNFSKN